MEKSKDFEAILASSADLIPHGVAVGANPSKKCSGDSNFENSTTENLNKNGRRNFNLLKYPDAMNLKELLEYDAKLQEAKASGIVLSPWQKQLAGLCKKRAENMMNISTSKRVDHKSNKKKQENDEIVVDLGKICKQNEADTFAEQGRASSTSPQSPADLIKYSQKISKVLTSNEVETEKTKANNEVVVGHPRYNWAQVTDQKKTTRRVSSEILPFAVHCGLQII